MKNATRFFVIVFFLHCGFATLTAQHFDLNRQFRAGDTDLLAGFGLLPTFLKDDVQQRLPPVSLRLEHRIVRNYSLALEVSHSVSVTRQDDPFEEDRQYRNSAYYFSLRNTVHCNCERIPEWDIYGGLSLTYYLTRIAVVDGSFGPQEKLHGIRPRREQFSYSGFVGARYACSGRLTFFGEAGYGISILRLGLGYKL